ncbi:hypothetical protein vseg_016486 [Gypsophila vaccaria]
MAELPTSPTKQQNRSLETTVIIDCKTPSSSSSSSSSAVKQVIEEKTRQDFTTVDAFKCKPSPGLCTPDRLKLPKPFKYPERYTSPTDHMMSPISKGLLARTRRGRAGALLPPSITPSKIHELQPQAT